MSHCVWLLLGVSRYRRFLFRSWLLWGSFILGLASAVSWHTSDLYLRGWTTSRIMSDGFDRAQVCLVGPFLTPPTG